MTSSKAIPPDGGYGWVVVASAFFVVGLSTAVLKNFGLFFLDIQDHFGVLTSTTSWVTSTTIALFHLGVFTENGHYCGGLVACSGMVLASLDLSLPWLYLSMGVLQGSGIALCWTPANSIVNHYFVRWRPIACAVASSGECVFAVMFGPFFQWLIEMYSWQGALLIIGGLQLNLCVCGALMRPLEETTQETKDFPDGDDAVSLPTRKTIFQFSLLRKPELCIYILFAIFAAAGFFIPPLFLVPFANTLGIDTYWSASVLSVLAMADLAGRLICGWVANMRLMRNLQLLLVVSTLLGGVLLLLSVSNSYWTIVALVSLYGFLFGCVVSVHIITIVDIVTLEGFDSGLGLFMMFRTIGGFMGPPAAGWLVDETDDYRCAFYLSGLCLLSSAVFVIIVDRLIQRRKAADLIVSLPVCRPITGEKP